MQLNKACQLEQQTFAVQSMLLASGIIYPGKRDWFEAVIQQSSCDPVRRTVGCFL